MVSIDDMQNAIADAVENAIYDLTDKFEEIIKEMKDNIKSLEDRIKNLEEIIQNKP